MNHLYRLVWNNAISCWQAVAETACSHHKNSKKSGKTSAASTLDSCANANKVSRIYIKPILLKPVALSILLAFSAQLLSSAALAEPSGGQVTAGAGTINRAGAVTTINQATQRMAVDWHSFNIRANEAVRFNQPNANAIALNRVTGTESSSIMGSLTANGKVFILNPNGILFGTGAQVNVGGLVASTLNLSNANFMAGNFNFTGNGKGNIINQGNINIAQGGTLAFIAPLVKNTGSIVAQQGKVLLAAADDVTLTMLDGNMVSYTINKGSVQTLIDNGGLIQADGGHVVLTAKGVDALSKSVINHTGIIEAQTVSSKNGKIELLGDMQIGTLNMAGKIDASAPASKNPNGGNGGFVETSAAKVKIANSARVTTLAANGKNGTWLIDPTDFTVAATGGDMTGQAVTNALAGGNFIIDSDNGAGGTGGNVYINDAISWSANTLRIEADNNIYINKNLNGSGTAMLAFNYGLGSADGGTSDYFIKGAKIYLPEGLNFRTKKGFDGEVTPYQVITRLGVAGDTSTTTLQGIQNNLSGNYVLGDNIDAAETSQWNDGIGWIPLGFVSQSDPKWGVGFSGIFDGLNHTIENLTINQPSDTAISTGLFSFNSGILKSVHLDNASVSGNEWVGALAGQNRGVIKNVSAISNVFGVSQVGGLVGLNYYSELTNTHAVVESSSSSGLVNGINGATRGYDSVGGLVGGNVGIISNSYSSSQVTGVLENSGGLVGLMYPENGFVGAIRNSYSSGGVTGTTNVGGLVGFFVEGELTNSYWDTQTSGQTTSAGGTGKTTAEMQQQSTFVGWDFENVWRISPGDYPRLRALTQGTITIDPTALGIVAPNIAKVYDGVGVNAVHDLAALPGWDGGAFAIGLIDNDTITDTSIFTGTLSYDGTWLGARNAGQYSIIPTGLSSQKYEIQYGEGTLFIVPRVLDVAVTKTADGNATFNTGYTIINNTKIAGDIVNVTGSATVASANAGVYNSFVSNNLVTDNPNYTVNPVNTDDYEYTGTGQVVATIQSVNTPSVEPTEPTKQGDVNQPLSFNPNNPVTTVNTITNELNSGGKFYSTYVEIQEPPKMIIAGEVIQAPNEAMVNVSIGGNTAFSGPNSAFSGVGVKVKTKSITNPIPLGFKEVSLVLGQTYIVDEVTKNLINSTLEVFYDPSITEKILKYFGKAASDSFKGASQKIASKFIDKLKNTDIKELGKDGLKSIYMDIVKDVLKQVVGLSQNDTDSTMKATLKGSGEYLFDAFLSAIESAQSTKGLSPALASAKFKLDFTVQLGILTTKAVWKDAKVAGQILSSAYRNNQAKQNAVYTDFTYIVDIASKLQQGKTVSDNSVSYRINNSNIEHHLKPSSNLKPDGIKDIKLRMAQMLIDSKSDNPTVRDSASREMFELKAEAEAIKGEYGSYVGTLLKLTFPSVAY